MMNYCDKAVSYYGTIDLDSDSILRCTPELLDSQVLLYPFEEQFDTPAITVKFRDKGCGSFQIIGEKDVFRTVLGIYGDDFTEFFGVILGAFINRESSSHIRNDVFRKPSFPGSDLEPDIGFGPYHKESLYAVDGVKILKIVVASVKDIMGSDFIRDFIHHLRVVNIGWCNMHESRDLCFHIIKRVHLYSSFMLTEFGPLKY